MIYKFNSTKIKNFSSKCKATIKSEKVSYMHQERFVIQYNREITIENIYFFKNATAN